MNETCKNNEVDDRILTASHIDRGGVENVCWDIVVSVKNASLLANDV